MTLALHPAPDFISTNVRFALEEMELPQTLSIVDIKGGALASEVLRQVNPLRLIPGLEADEVTLFETAAILLWLLDRTGRLGPGPTNPDRGPLLFWLFFTSSALRQAALAMFYPDRPAGAANFAAAQSAAHNQIVARLGLLEPMMATGTARWLAPDCPGILSYYIGVLVRWLILLSPARYRIDLTDVPQLKAVLAAQRIAASNGLGPTPFTHPGP